jgi:DNA-binding MarR family transcriptional regulator
MPNEKVFALLQEAMTNLQPLYGEAMTNAIRATELDLPAWFTIVTINALTEPVRLEQFQALNPFTSLEQIKERVQPSQAKGYIEIEPDSNAYRLTDAGKEAATRPFKIVHKILDDTQPIDQGDLERLAELLARVVDATQEAEKPATKPNITRSRATHPGPDAGPVARIDQYITDLMYFRDDAHNGAWLPHGCSAQGWEVLTAVWREESDSIEALMEQFEARSYTQESLQEAVAEIAALGWLSKSDGKLTVTEAGAKLRQETEDLTDQYYFGPWEALTDTERGEFETLLTAYNAAIKPEEEPAETE